MTETTPETGEILAAWMIEAYQTLLKARDLLAQLAPAAPLLDEIDGLIERAEDPYPSLEERLSEPVAVQPEAGAPEAPAPDLVPEHQQDDLYDANEIVEPTHALAEFEPPAAAPESASLDGADETVQALALMLVLCRLLLENNGMSASGGFVNEALAIIEDLWPKVPSEIRAAAEAHAENWEEKAGW